MGNSGGYTTGANDTSNSPSKVNPPQLLSSDLPPLQRSTRVRLDTQARDDDPKYSITLYARKPQLDPTAVGAKHAFFTYDPEYAKKMASPEAGLWQEAMNDEIVTLQKLEVYHEVRPPPNAHVISCRWVYAMKQNAKGEVTCYKAQVVARGFNEHEGIDYDETYVPTPRKSSILTLLALAVHFDWEITQVDVKSAYLNGELKDEIYMTGLAGYLMNKKGAVWRLKKSLYGLKQSANCWYDKLTSILDDGGFKPTIDRCVFVAGDRYLGSHVDDMISITPTTKQCDVSCDHLTKQPHRVLPGHALYP